jgi:hypothetical protein
MAVYSCPFVNVTAFRCWLLVRRTGVDPSPTSTALRAHNLSRDCAQRVCYGAPCVVLSRSTRQHPEFI